MVIGVPNVGKSSLINSLRRLHLRKGISLVQEGATGTAVPRHVTCFSHSLLSPKEKPPQSVASQVSPRQC